MLIDFFYDTGICFHSPPERIIYFFLIQTSIRAGSIIATLSSKATQ